MAGRDQTTEAERELLARLDHAFAHQRDLDPTVLASVRGWQRTDRTYELVQQVVRGEPIAVANQSRLRAARRARRHLDLAIRSGFTRFPLRVFRGLRNIEASLGVPFPAQAPGRRIGLPGFSATTIFHAVAANEFTARHGVLLGLVVPSGTPALWVAGVGHPALRYQGELLLGAETRIDVYSHVHLAEAAPVLLGGVVSDE